ncbi:uncharacterized protein EI97DRAFT_77559 [Westerdykella ornata]|uniref:Nicotinamide N-methyltransferase n=1 Tax=Westerdykella ornata TaxID=318751 RepID=A0A6A6JGI6_WESOR|nr:uncharacterized protein EI97DRAFT_77559 [Westerdykella ornata]KAF2275532.1 hypothetical protein EI97DRAFT_77559 [Westerdykella ornata]
MQPLPALITLHHPPTYSPSPEDIFSTTLGSLFPDDLQNQHGDADADAVIVYASRRLGDLEFRTADVHGEEQRTKFAHYLWNAGVLMAELVAGREGDGDDGEWWLSREEEGKWDVQGEKVLELGAGVGLAGIAAALSGAHAVAISDYPAPPILDAIKTNVTKNIPNNIKPSVTIEGHKWGDLSTPFAQQHAHSFTRILAADCYWMPHEHDNLARSMTHFLSESPEARVLCIGGFHTGRAKIAGFFEEAVPEAGLEVEEIFEMDATGQRREWRPVRDGGREDIGERKKWLVLARLRRAKKQ